MREVELVVIGAGPAGVAAARAAATHGVAVLLVDERPLEPALMRRNIPRWFGAREGGRERREDLFRWVGARPDLAEAVDQGVELLAGHSAWGVFPEGVVGLYDGDRGGRTFLIRAGQLVLAPGATDLHLAFPGWTRSGVLGGGGALYLLDAFGHLDARRMVVLGSGNLALAVARAAARSGVQVAGMVEVAAEVQGEVALAAELAAAGVSFYPHHMIVEAAGGADVEEVRLRTLDGRPEVRIAADCVCVAIGQQPAVDLASLAGCELDFDPARGGWYPRHDRLQRTTIEGLLVAGDAAGVLDAAVLDASAVREQGRLAGLAAAAALGRVVDIAAVTVDWHAAEPGTSPPGRVAAGRGHGGYAGCAGYATEWHRLADLEGGDDLLVCRCEEVSRGALLAARALAGSDHPDEVKRISRAGMGLCQGRGCRPLVSGLLAARAGRAYAEVPLASYRPPLRPIPLAALATEEEQLLPSLAPFEAAAARLTREIEARTLTPLAVARFRKSAEELEFQCVREGASEERVRRLAEQLEAHIRATQGRTGGGEVSAATGPAGPAGPTGPTGFREPGQ